MVFKKNSKKKNRPKEPPTLLGFFHENYQFLEVFEIIKIDG